MNIHITKFVRRQTEKSEFTHWTLTDDELIENIKKNFDKAKEGYRSGVLLVPLDPYKIWSSTVILKEGDRLFGEFKSRVPGEDPRKTLKTSGAKSPALNAYAVLYSHDVLAENNEAESEADFELVSVNSSPTEEEAPIVVDALIANHFELSGGTKTNLSDSEFVDMLRKSVLYWKDKAFVAGK